MSWILGTKTLELLQKLEDRGSLHSTGLTEQERKILQLDLVHNELAESVHPIGSGAYYKITKEGREALWENENREVEGWTTITPFVNVKFDSQGEIDAVHHILMDALSEFARSREGRSKRQDKRANVARKLHSAIQPPRHRSCSQHHFHDVHSLQFTIEEKAK